MGMVVCGCMTIIRSRCEKCKKKDCDIFAYVAIILYLCTEFFFKYE